MSTTDAVFKSTLTPEFVEWGYSQMLRAFDQRREDYAVIGMRAARARDPKLLMALEAMAETTLSLQENQMGRLMRSPDASFGESRGTTEHQLCREAYKMADKGEAMEQFQWVYLAAAFLCGYIR